MSPCGGRPSRSHLRCSQAKPQRDALLVAEPMSVAQVARREGGASERIDMGQADGGRVTDIVFCSSSARSVALSDAGREASRHRS